jgi:hypothetical protein
VAAGQVGVGARFGGEQRRVFENDLVACIAVADPEFIGAFLIPCRPGLAAVDFNVQPVFASRGDLAGDHASTRARAHVKQDSAEIFCAYRSYNVIFRAEKLVGKALNGVFGLLAGCVEGLQVGDQRGDAQAGDVLGHVEPVRADIGHAARRAASLRVDAPVPVRVVEQPVLRISALHGENLAQLAGLSHAAQLLHHGVVAQIVADAVAQPRLRGQGNQFPRLADGCGQRLFADHVLAGFERLFGHRIVQRVGGEDVDRIDGRIAENLPIVGGNSRDAKARAQLPRDFQIPACYGHDLDRFLPPERVEMNTAHEAGAEDCHFSWFHRFTICCFIRPTRQRRSARESQYRQGSWPPWSGLLRH